jgi:uncharacterized membrane protein YkoI
LPLRSIVEFAADQYPGEVINARLRETAGMLVYELRILSPDGRRVETVFFDARTGREVRN